MGENRLPNAAATTDGTHTASLGKTNLFSPFLINLLLNAKTQQRVSDFRAAKIQQISYRQVINCVKNAQKKKKK